MDLKELERTWNNYGLKDPLWAVLTWREKEGGKWDVEEFFEQGRIEIESVMNRVNSLAPSLKRRKALDFGCAVGRLTQALAGHFDEVVGVDIAESMIGLAKRYNKCGGRCQYHVSAAEDLGLFSDSEFDLIYSSLVLQHMAPRYALAYIKEFVRLLQPNGVLVFQMTSRPGTFVRRVAFSLLPDQMIRVLRMVKYRTVHPIQMYGIRREEIVSLLEGMGVRILEIIDETPPRGGWEDFRYFVSKP